MQTKKYSIPKRLINEIKVEINSKYLDVIFSKAYALVLIISQIYKPNDKITKYISIDNNNNKIIQFYVEYSKYIEEMKKIDIDNPLLYLYSKWYESAIYMYHINQNCVVFLIKHYSQNFDYTKGLNLIKKFINSNLSLININWIPSNIEEFCFGLISNYKPNNNKYVKQSLDFTIYFDIEKIFYYKKD